MKKQSSSLSDRIWVEVEVNKYTDGVTVFRGLMLRTDLEGWVRGERVDCGIKLEKTYWFLEEGACILGKGDDVANQYVGDLYLRADTIMLIFILKEDSYPMGEDVPGPGKIFPFPDRLK